MKIRFLSMVAFAVGLVSAAHAVGPGFYVGAQAGTTNTHNETRNIQTNTVPSTTLRVNPSNTGGGGRFFLGYNVNPYFAAEGGFTHYAASTYSVPASAMIACNDPAIRENAFDFVGKGMFPMANFGVYAKAGISVIRVSMSGSINPSNTNMSACSSNSNSGTTTSGRPILGVGMSYDLNQNWVADISWTRVMSGSNVQNADFVALGIAYHITDKYCGQFLC